jgi:hypothetical protein
VGRLDGDPLGEFVCILRREVNLGNSVAPEVGPLRLLELPIYVDRSIYGANHVGKW